jgi:hypothetical protein
MIINKRSEENNIELLIIIDNLKEKLVQSGFEHGLNDPKTLKISQQLDIYIVQYQRLIAKKSG